MENKDTNTHYQKYVRVGDQKWEIVEITIGIIFFAWDSYSLFFIRTMSTQVFKVSFQDIFDVLTVCVRGCQESSGSVFDKECVAAWKPGI